MLYFFKIYRWCIAKTNPTDDNHYNQQQVFSGI